MCFVKKDLLPPVISLAAVIIIVHDGYMVSITNLFIAGVIPGTSLVLPSWIMIAFYCFAITAIITMYVEGVFTGVKENRLTKRRKSQLPHKRYSEI